MAVTHGRVAKVYANGYDLSAFLSSISVAGEADTAETSTFGSTAKSYIPGLVDATLSAEGFYDGAASAVDQILAAALGVDAVLWTVLPQGDGFGNRGTFASTIETGYEVSSEIGDASKVSAEAQSKSGMEAAQVLHALGAETATANGTNIDNGASSANGASAALHVTARSGASPSLTAKVQHSVDNSVWVDLMTFTAVTTPNVAQRLEVTGTVNRHLRATWAITGTSPSFTFNLAACRK